MIDQEDIEGDYMSSTSSDKYNEYIFDLKLKLCDSEIENIFGTTELAMLDCSDMTEEEINRIIEKFNSIPEVYPISRNDLVKAMVISKAMEIAERDNV